MHLKSVIAGLDPAIHVFEPMEQDVDTRVEPGYDDPN
jgi:hypothetical protein